MRHLVRRLWIGFLMTGCVAEIGLRRRSLTWQEARDEFANSNPTLRAAQIGIDESRADEVTAFLRPNPDLTLDMDQINSFTNNPIHYNTARLRTHSRSSPRAICTSGSISANCGWRARRRRPPSPNRSWRTRNAT